MPRHLLIVARFELIDDARAEIETLGNLGLAPAKLKTLLPQDLTGIAPSGVYRFGLHCGHFCSD